MAEYSQEKGKVYKFKCELAEDDLPLAPEEKTNSRDYSGGSTLPTNKNNPSWKKAIKVGLIASTAKKTVNFITSNYGNMTGNYIAQTKLENISRVVGYGTTLALGGVIAGPIGIGVAAAKVAFDMGMQEWQRQIEYKKQEASYQVLAQRMNISRTGGGRG